MNDLILKSTPTTCDAALDASLRGLSVESAVLADLEKLKTDAPHRAAVRKLLWERTKEINGRLGYCSRPWWKALEVLESLDTTHPLALTDEDAWIALHAKDHLNQFRYNASLDPESWWHSEGLWRKFCADRQWIPEEHL